MALQNENNEEAVESNDLIHGKLIPVLSVLALGSYLATSIHAPSIFAQLTLGNWIHAHADVPREDIWSLTTGSGAFFHYEWLFAVILSGVENLGGELGLVAFKAVSFIFFVSSLAFLFCSRAQDRFIGLLLASLVACGVLEQSAFSASILGWSFLAIMLECFYRGHEISRSKTKLLIVILLSVLYSNLHSSSVFALIVVLFFALEAHKVDKKVLFMFTLILAVSQFINPYLGLQAYSAVIEFFNQVSFEIFYRTNPATIYNFRAAFLVLFWMILAVFWHFHVKALRPFEVSVAAAISLLACGADFLLPYALIATGLLISLLWGRVGGEDLGNLGESFHQLKRMLSSLSPVGLAWVILCILIVNTVRLHKDPINTALLPVREVDYLLNEKLEGPVFHEAFIGPYLMYRFADGRGEPKRKVLTMPWVRRLSREDAVSEHGMQTLSPIWAEWFAKVSPKTVVCRINTPLYSLLRARQDWQLKFEARAEFPPPEDTEVKRHIFAWAVFSQIENS